MSPERPGLIWATRGRSWGFRFLRDGGLDDPLPTYEAAFAGIGGGIDILKRGTTHLAVRLADPEGRRDGAGRVIAHDFVVPLAVATDIHTPEDGSRALWAPVAEEYARMWGAVSP